MAAAQVLVTHSTSVVSSLGECQPTSFLPSTSSTHSLCSLNHEQSSSSSPKNFVENLSASIKAVAFLNLAEDFVLKCAMDMKHRGLLVDCTSLFNECEKYAVDLFENEVSSNRATTENLAVSHYMSSTCSLPSLVQYSSLPPSDHPLAEKLALSSSSNSSSSSSAAGDSSIFQKIITSQFGFDNCMAQQSDQNSVSSLNTSMGTQNCQNSVPSFNTTMEAQSYQNSVPSFNTTMEAQSYQNSVPGDIQEDCVDGPLLPLLSNISFDGLAGWQLASLDVSADHLEINSVSSLSLPPDMVSPGHSLSVYKSSNDLPSVASLLKSQPNTNADEKVLNMTSSRSSIQHFEASKIVDCPSKESSQKDTTDLQNIVFDETEMLQKISSTDVIVDTEDIKKQVPIKSQRSLERQSSPPEKGEVLTVCLKLVKAENELLEKSRMCSSCSLKPRDVTFLPCGHFATCRSCAEPIFTCPICNNNILATLNTYLS